MRNMIVCTRCWDADMDGKPVVSQIEAIKLILIAKFTPDLIDIKEYICPNCSIFFTEQKNVAIESF